MIALGAILALAYIPGWTGGALLTGWAVLSAALPFFLRELKMTPIHWLGLLFLAYAVGSLAWTSSFLDGIQSIWHLSILAVAFCVGSKLRYSTEKLFIGLGLGVAVSSAIAVVQWLGFDTINSAVPPSGLFFNRNILAEVSIVTIIGLVCWQRYWLAAALVPGYLVSFDRASIAALGAAGAISLWHRDKVLAILTAIIGALVIFGIHHPYLDRIDIWLTTSDGFRLFGNGAGAFIGFYNNLRIEQAHNDIFELTFLYGIGILPLLVAIGLLYRSILERELIIFTSIATIALFNTILGQPVLAFVGAFVAGRLAVARLGFHPSRSTLSLWMEVQRLYHA